MDKVEHEESRHKLERSVNIAIAEKVFGHKVVEERWGKQKQYGALSLGPPVWNDYSGEMILDNRLPDYCNKIKHAFSVIEELKCTMELCREQVGQDESDWSCTLGRKQYKAYARTAPMAICKAALLMLKDDTDYCGAV